MDASNGAPERAPKSVPSVRSVVFESRFRRSIRLEATRRALQGQWIRQAAVWLCSFSEVLAVASVPGVHLITNPWFTMAALFLMFLLACWRAGSVLDVFFQPAHLLRPKNYSRFGLGESQSSCRTFYSLSMLLRVTCAAVLASRFLTYVYGQSDWHLCSAFWYPWAEYKSSELEKDLVLCRAFPDFSSWCPTILGFGQRCHDPVRWSTQLRSYAFNELGLECNSSQTADLAALASVSEDLYGFHCESLNGSEVECYPYPLPDFTLLQEDLIIYTDPVETSLEVCKSWPPVNVFYECQMFWDEVSECSRISQTPLRTALESVVSKFCELQRCKSTLPQWLKAPLNEEELFFFCQCQHCTPWHRSNECIVEVLDQAMRRAAGFQFLAEIEAHAFFSDPLFTLHFILVATCVGGPVLWLFASLLFCCCVGNPWAVPVDVKLQELVQMEETALQAELASQGTTEGYLNRLWILMAVGFCVADFVTDIRMVVLYLQTYHYSFALIQGLFVVRSLLEQLLRRGLLYFFQEFRVSMKANLWTDNLLAVVQSEKTGEATLAFILQIYSLFYMGEELLGYWTALISLLIGARGLTQGCYIHFDLAFIASENLPPIYEDDLPEAPEPSSVVPAPVRSVPTVPTLEMPPPLLVESLPKLDGEPKDLPEAPPPPADLQGEMPDLDEGIGENLRPTAVHPNVEVPGPTGPMVLGKGQNVILAL